MNHMPKWGGKRSSFNFSISGCERRVKDPKLWAYRAAEEPLSTLVWGLGPVASGQMVLPKTLETPRMAFA